MAEQEKLFVTTAIPYANGKPHIGNALEYLYADTWARYHRQRGSEVRVQIGTDEHGSKIARKAIEQGLTPQEYVNQTHVPFRELAERLDTDYTDFVRTSDEHHERTAAYVWQKLSPYIYKDTYAGWYSSGEESFVTQKEYDTNGGIAPLHNQPYEWLEEENYYFRASVFSDQVRQAIVSDQLKITPKRRRDEFLKLIEHGLKDVSISRPREHLSWGVPVPDDPDHVMYVWFEALLCYVSTIGYPDREEEFQAHWPADLQLQGKDITRFQAGLWPAILLGLGLELPRAQLVHGFVNVSGVKMSKTIGNVIDPKDIIDRYGVDAFRYYFLRHIPTQDDGDFTWKKFHRAYVRELSNDLGNLTLRIVGLANKFHTAPNINEVKLTDEAYDRAFAELKFNEAFDVVWQRIVTINGYLAAEAPWKSQDESAARRIIDNAASDLYNTTRFLEPFLPNAAQRIRTSLRSPRTPDAHTALFKRVEEPQ